MKTPEDSIGPGARYPTKSKRELASTQSLTAADARAELARVKRIERRVTILVGGMIAGAGVALAAAAVYAATRK